MMAKWHSQHQESINRVPAREDGGGVSANTWSQENVGGVKANRRRFALDPTESANAETDPRLASLNLARWFLAATACGDGKKPQRPTITSHAEFAYM